MVLSADRQRVKALLTETITLLCKNGLHFKSGFSIEALIGITLDEDDVFLVSIKETIQPVSSGLANSICNLELDKQNSCNYDASAEHQVMSGTIQEYEPRQGCEDALPKTNFSTVKTDVQDRGGKVLEKCCRSPETVEQNFEPTLKRRFSESSDQEDHYAASFIRETQNSNSVFLEFSNFKRDLLNKEGLSRHAEDGDSGRDLLLTRQQSQRAQSHESCEMVDVKLEPHSEDEEEEDPTFQGNDPENSSSINQDSFSPNSGSSKPAVFLAWNGYARFGQHEVLNSVKSNSSMTLPIDDLNRTGHQSSQARPHRCSKCNKSFTTVQGRNLHEKLHDGIYQYNCPHCGKGCSGTTQLRGHMATHTQVKEFKCPICGHAYVYKKTLTDHIKRLHMDILSMPIM